MAESVETPTCPICQGTGTEWILVYTLKERPHDDLTRTVSEEFARSFFQEDYPDYSWAEIENQECACLKN